MPNGFKDFLGKDSVETGFVFLFYKLLLQTTKKKWIKNSVINEIRRRMITLNPTFWWILPLTVQKSEVEGAGGSLRSSKLIKEQIFFKSPLCRWLSRRAGESNKEGNSGHLRLRARHVPPERWKGRENVSRVSNGRRKFRKLYLIGIFSWVISCWLTDIKTLKLLVVTAQFIKQEWVSILFGFFSPAFLYWRLPVLSIAWASWFVADWLGSCKVAQMWRKLTLCLRSESAFQGNQYNFTLRLCDWECLV